MQASEHDFKTGKHPMFTGKGLTLVAAVTSFVLLYWLSQASTSPADPRAGRVKSDFLCAYALHDADKLRKGLREDGSNGYALSGAMLLEDHRAITLKRGIPVRIEDDASGQFYKIAPLADEYSDGKPCWIPTQLIEPNPPQSK